MRTTRMSFWVSVPAMLKGLHLDQDFLRDLVIMTLLDPGSQHAAACSLFSLSAIHS